MHNNKPQSKLLPVNEMTPKQLAAWVLSVVRLTTLDRLKLWPVSYHRPTFWVGYGLSHDNGTVHRRFHCRAQFSFN